MPRYRFAAKYPDAVFATPPTAEDLAAWVNGRTFDHPELPIDAIDHNGVKLQAFIPPLAIIDSANWQGPKFSLTSAALILTVDAATLEEAHGKLEKEFYTFAVGDVMHAPTGGKWDVAICLPKTAVQNSASWEET